MVIASKALDGRRIGPGRTRALSAALMVAVLGSTAGSAEPAMMDERPESRRDAGAVIAADVVGVRFDTATATLSADVRDADLHTLIEEVARLSGRPVRLRTAVEARIDARFKGLPLRGAITELLCDRDHLIAEGDDGGIDVWVLQAKGERPRYPTEAAPGGAVPPAGVGAPGDTAVGAESEALEEDLPDPEVLEQIQLELEAQEEAAEPQRRR
jgi:hypothetical protein